jgi:hypothetical protein
MEEGPEYRRRGGRFMLTDWLIAVVTSMVVDLILIAARELYTWLYNSDASSIPEEKQLSRYRVLSI